MEEKEECDEKQMKEGRKIKTQRRGIYQGDKDPYFSKTVEYGCAATRAHYTSAVWSVSKDSNGDGLSQRCRCCYEVTKQLYSQEEKSLQNAVIESST